MSVNPVSAIFQCESLDAHHHFWRGSIPMPPAENGLQIPGFSRLWALHPPQHHRLKIMGREVLSPRWQQAYGKNYRYTGTQNHALPIPKHFLPFQQWCQQHIDPRLNGLLVNWYDGAENHYMGAHRDDIRDIIEGSPIVTISLGERRIFRFRPWKQQGYVDFLMQNRDVMVIPWDTNLAYTHEIPKFKKDQGKRISVTLRVYAE